MADTLTDIADAADALCNPRHHSEPRHEWDRNRHRKPLAPHNTVVPGLIQQLRILAEEGATSNDESGVRSVPNSRPPGAFDAVALVAAITFGAAWRLTNPVKDGGLGLPARDTAERNISAIVGACPQAGSEIQCDIRRELRSWQRQAEVITGWAQPPIELVAPCPVVDTDGSGTPCGKRGTLAAQRDGTFASCMACHAVWDETTIGLLLAHVRRYTEASRAAAEAVRLRVRADKAAFRKAEREARERRQSVA